MIKRIQSLTLILFVLISFGCKEDIKNKEGVRIGLTYGKIQAIAYMIGVDVNEQYCSVIENSGGRIIRLSVRDTDGEIDKKLDTIEGLLVPGGFDVDPARYDEERDEKLEDVDEELDRLEFKVLKYARNKGIPILGICRGHQITNVFFGGSLYQDIPSQYKGTVVVSHRGKEKTFGCYSREHCSHDITIERDSLLFRILKINTLTVNSYHHQAVKKLAPGLRITARSADGSVEALEGTGEQFVLGVQFHPEKMLKEEPVLNEIFRVFVKECLKKEKVAAQ